MRRNISSMSRAIPFHPAKCYSEKALGAFKDGRRRAPNVNPSTISAKIQYGLTHGQGLIDNIKKEEIGAVINAAIPQ